jgi:FkbM family methyltransferase
MITNAARVLLHMGPIGFLKACYFYALIVLYRDILGKRYIRKKIFGSWMDLDTRDLGISRTLILFGRREKDHRILLAKVLREGMTVLDIGANIGYYALMERHSVGESGTIVAVEPAPPTVELLRRNVELNGYKNIHIIQAGVSNVEEKKTFFVSPLSNQSSLHHDERVHTSGDEIEIETRTVPDLMSKYGAPDLIRMDVEGHEVEIIDGMIEAIENGDMAPMIILEPHIRTYGPDHDFEAPLRRLFKSGYHARYVASSMEAGTRRINALGYKGTAPFRTDFKWRAIYENLSDDHVIDLLTRTGGIRTLLLAKAEPAAANN